MACLFLDKLPSELRKQIYEYVLDFGVPLRHATQLQPFVKNLTGVDGELPFDYQDEKASESASAWIPMEETLVANTSIISTSKLIYTEAIKVFYDLNIISVDVELFKLAITSPTASDLSLTKRLDITFNPSRDEKVQNSRFFNTINMKVFVPVCQALFPKLQGAVVLVDGTAKPSTSLFDIAHDCLATRSFCRLTFEEIGDCIATATNGLTLRIKYKRLIDVQQEMVRMSDANVSISMRRLNNAVYTFDNQVLMATLYKGFLNQAPERYETLTAKLLADHRTRMTFASSMFSEMEVNSVAFWTEIACPYEGYPEDEELENGDDGDDSDGSVGSDEIVRVDNLEPVRDLA